MSGFRIRALIEDRGHEKMLRGLVERKQRARDLYVEPYPKGRGAAEKFVRDQFPAFVTDLRRKKNQGSLWGVVVVDGDVEGFQRRRTHLLDALAGAAIAPLSTEDRVVVLVPTRNVETWAWCLLANQVDEETDYKQLVTTDLRRLFAASWEPVRQGEPLSLSAGRAEWGRLP